MAAAVLLSFAILYVHESAQARAANFRGNGWGSQPAPTPVTPPPPEPVTSSDSDGDGIPNTWEIANSHNSSSAADASSDFDFDGLTARQEYDLSVRTGGEYGKPLGTYELETIPDPPGYTTLSAVTLVESAKNGVTVIRVVGVRAGSSTSSTRAYTYSPLTGLWTWVIPPAGVAQTTVLTPTDVNSRGQVVGYYSSGGNKGFLWTPSTSAPSGGESKQFFLDPTATAPVPAFPRRISDSGYLLYSTGSPTAQLQAADPKQRPISPLASSWSGPAYLDVNDFGEYVGTIISPITGLRHTFLAIPDGPFHLSAPTFADLVDNGLATESILDETSIQWLQLPEYVYPDDYYDENGNYSDPYADYPQYTVFEYGTAVVGNALHQIRKSRYTPVIYWKDLGENANNWHAEIRTYTFSPPAALNDWGEFVGDYTYQLREESYYYNYYYSDYDYEWNETGSIGSFLYDGNYHFNPTGKSVAGMSNDPQVLLGEAGNGTHLWSDSVTAPLAMLLPVGVTGTILKTKLCDNGLMVLQKTAKVLQTLTPSDDTDGDGMPDDWEVFYGFNPAFKDAGADADGDGSNNLGEFLLRTDPNAAPVYDPDGNLIDTRPGIDTDGDGIPNSWEHANDLDYDDPSDAPMDFDRDGYTNLQEFHLNTNPRGAPSYRIREIGPFPHTMTTWISPGVLGEQPMPTQSDPTAAVSDSFYFRAQSGLFTIPSAWTVQQGADEGTHTLYPSTTTVGGVIAQGTGLLAQSAGGASLGGLVSTPNKSLYFWSSPTANPVRFSGLPLGVNATPFVNSVRISPEGKHVAGYRYSSTNPGTLELIGWKMPEGGTTYNAVALPLPAGATLNTSDPLFLTDYGHYAAAVTIAGMSRVVLWQVNGTTVTTTVLSNLPDRPRATLSGISNQIDPVVTGTSMTGGGQSLATIWKSDGSAIPLGTLEGGDSSSATVISPGGLVGGISKVLVNGSMKSQPFVAAFDGASSFWKMKAVGAPGANFVLKKITDAGEMLGMDNQVSPVSRAVPTLWRHGKAFALDEILPPSSGYALTGITSMNQNGTLLVEASRNGARIYLLLTPDRDTDADGFPDAYEARIDFNPFAKNDPRLDTDDDGLSDADEYKNGTNIRSPDTDEDGMKDGWEVSWGLRPLDPTDAGLDPDGDSVENLREFQIGTCPTGIYVVDTRVVGTNVDHVDFQPNVTSVGENGTIIYTSGEFFEHREEPDGSYVYMSGPSYWFMPRQPGYQGEIVPLRPFGNSYGYDPEGNQNLYTDACYLNYGVDPVSNNINGFFVRSFGTFVGNQWDWRWDALMSPDASYYHAETSSWVSWQQVQDNLHTPVNEEDPILGASDSLDAVPLRVSPSGNFRLHRAQPSGERFMLDAQGGYIGTIPSNYPLDKLNNNGEGVSLTRTPVAATSELPAYYSGTINWGKDGLVTSVPVPTPPGTSVNSLVHFSDSSTVVLRCSYRNAQAAEETIYHLLDLGSEELYPITLPGLGSESIVSISAQNDRMVGSGPKPFQITPDGSCVRIESLRIRSGPAAVVPFETLYPRPLVPCYVNKDGMITLTTSDGANSMVLQLVPETDSDNDGVPDDWERSIIDQLNASRPPGSTEPVISTDVSQFDVDADNDGDGRTVKQEWRAGTSDGSRENVRSLLRTPSEPKDRDMDGVLNVDDADPDDKQVDWMKTAEPVYVLRDLGEMRESLFCDLTINGDILTSRQTDSSPSRRIFTTYSGEDGSVKEVVEDRVPDETSTEEPFYYKSVVWLAPGFGSSGILREADQLHDLSQIFWRHTTEASHDEEDNYEESIVDESVIKDDDGTLTPVDDLLIFEYENGMGLAFSPVLEPRDREYDHVFLTDGLGSEVLPNSDETLFAVNAHGRFDLDLQNNVCHMGSRPGKSTYWEYGQNGYLNPIIFDGVPNSTATLSQSIPQYTGSNGLLVAPRTLERHLAPTKNGLFVAQQGGGFSNCATAAGELRAFDTEIGDVTSDGWISANSAGKPYMWVNGRWSHLSDFVMGNPQISRVLKMQENGMAAVMLPGTTAGPHLGLLIPIDMDPRVGSGSPDAMDPSNPAYVREVKLSGVQKTEEKPQEGAEIDLPGEDTSVDALNRRLRHDTSIAYVDVPASDLDLAIKLSVDNSPVGIPSLTNLAATGQGISEKDMRKTMTRSVARSARENMGGFGLGWKSNVDAKVVCKPIFAKTPVAKANKQSPISPRDAKTNRDFKGYDVHVTDENGQTFRFFSANLTSFTSSGVELRDVSGFQTSLERTGDILSLNRKYGTSTKFRWTSTPPEFPDGTTVSDGFWNAPAVYTAALTGFSDRFGNQVALSLTSSSAATGKREMTLAAVGRTDLKLKLGYETLSSPDKANTFSLVTSVTNPRGFKVSLVYKWVECWGAWLPALSQVVQPDGTATRYNYATRLENAAEGAAAGKGVWNSGRNATGQQQGGTTLERAANKEDTDDEYGSDEGMMTFFHVNLASVTDPAGKATSIQWEQDVRYDTTVIWQKCKANIAHYSAGMRDALNGRLGQAEGFRKNREWKKIDRSMAKRGAVRIAEGMYVTRARGVPDVVRGVSISSGMFGSTSLGFTIRQDRPAAPAYQSENPTAAEQLDTFKKGSPDTSGGMTVGRDISRLGMIETLVTDLEGKQTIYRFSDFQTLMTPVKPPQPGDPPPPVLETNEEAFNNMSRRKGLGYGRMECLTDRPEGGIAGVSYEFDAEANYALKKSKDLHGNANEYEHHDLLNGQKYTAATRIFKSGVDEEHDLLVMTKFDDPNSEVRKDPSGNVLARRDFKYGSTHRLMTSEVDANGNETVYVHDTMGRVTDELSYSGKQVSGTLVGHKSMHYHTTFKNFVIKETVKTLPSSGKPAWETDLVTTFEPDANGFVWKTIVDPGGLAITTEKTYDKGGNVLTSKDAKNYVTTFAYDSVGRLTSTAYHDQTKRTYGYDSAGRKIRETDENGHSTLWKYDGFGRVEKTGADMNGNDKIDAGDLITSTTYNNLGQPLTVTDPRGNVTQYGYDSWHRLISTTDPLGGITSFDYSGPNSGTGLANDPKWLPTRVMEARGFLTETEYDNQYRAVSVRKEYQLPVLTSNWTTRPLGPCTHGETVYDDNGNATETWEFCPGRTTRITTTAFDALDRPYLVTSGSGTSLEFSTRTYHTSTGLPWKTVSFEGNSLLQRESLAEYDGAGRAVKSTAPDPATGGITVDSAVTQTHYDKNSNVDYTIDPLGNRTDFEYDTRNRQTKSLAPAAVDSSVAGNPSVRAQSVTTYDSAGNVRSVTDHYGTVTETTYDAANRAIQVIAAKNRTEQAVTDTEYDANGNVTLVTDANGNRTRNFYDAANRLIGTAVNPVSGNPSSSLASPGADDIVVANVYDAGGNLVRVADGAASKTFSGNAWNLTLAAGHVTGFTYDGIGRKLTTVWDVGSAVAKTETSVYDALHQTERVDAKSQHTQYTYDDIGRPDEVVYVGRTADNRRHLYKGGSGTNSGPGVLVAVTHPNAGGTLRDVSYTHDRLDQVTSETSAAVTHQYAYDKAGNRGLVTYGTTNRKVVSKYDTSHRLVSSIETIGAVSNPLTYTAQSGDRTTTWRYDALGHPVRLEMPNGTATAKTFDRLGRVLLMNTLNGVGAVISGYNYTGGYDKVGNVLSFLETSATLPARSMVNQYDRTYRLTRESDSLSNPVFHYYDKACNRTGKSTGGVTDTYEFGTPASGYNTNQLRGVVRSTNSTQYAVSYTYDNNGNRASRAENGQTDTLLYDYDNRLISLTKNTGTTGLGSYAYQYDYRTRRVWRDEPGSSDASLSFSGGLSVQEYSRAPGAGTQPAVETLRGSDLGGGVGGVLYTLRGGTASFDSYNSRGDVVSQTNSGGGVEWQASYEAFGTRKAESSTPNLDRHRANTKDEDPTGLLNEGMRYRDLETGVFITRDPAGFVDGPNVYAYVTQNPWTSFDPDGLKKISHYKKKMVILRKKAAEKDAAAKSKGYKGMKFLLASGWDEKLQIREAKEAIEGIVNTAKAIKDYTDVDVDADLLDDEGKDYKSFNTIHFWHSINPEKQVGDDLAKGNYKDAGKHFARDVVIGVVTQAAGGALLRAASAEVGVAANTAGRTNAQLVQDIATRAEAWGTRQGIPAAGSGPVQGTLKHGYAERLLDRYQSLYGSRGLQTEASYLNGQAVPYGTKGSVRLDVYEPSTGSVWDYKFTPNPSLPASRVQRIINNGPAGINSVDAVGP